MHDEMDNYLNPAKETIINHIRAGNLGEGWDMLTTSVENGWLKYQGYNKQVSKAMKGRGKFTIIKKSPIPPKQTEEEQFQTIRNEHSRTALKQLRQARRFEQITHRLGLIAKDSTQATDKTTKHVQLNIEALKAIKRNLIWNDTWQNKLRGQMFQVERDARNTMKAS